MTFLLDRAVAFLHGEHLVPYGLNRSAYP